MISTPFTFTREKRHGILDNTSALGKMGCSPGPAIYNIESSTAVASASTLASTPMLSKNAAAFMIRVRSEGQLKQRQAAETTRYSKVLAQSYQDLSSSVQKLERRIAPPELREQYLQRFQKDVTAVEAHRRGPGSYKASGEVTPVQRNDMESKEACRRSSWCQLSPLPIAKQKQLSSFGRVASRDLLTSMIAAGHASPHTIGPGIYDAYPPSVTLPTHNIVYKQEMKRSEKPHRHKPRPSTNSDTNQDKLSAREMWKAMRQGPSLPL